MDQTTDNSDNNQNNMGFGLKLGKWRYLKSSEIDLIMKQINA